MQFLFAPYPQAGDPFKEGDVAKGAQIVNNSWGCPRVEGCDTGVFEPAMKALRNAGVFMSVSAGNTGNYGCSTVEDPLAIYREVFTVGSVDKVGQLSTFSSVGPVDLFGDRYQKPDLIAPGEQILLAAPGGTYTFASGTSFSAPHVTGVVALMWSANPALIGDIDTTTRILLETAQPFNGVEPDCGQGDPGSGAGILDAYAAVMAAIGLK
jgi:subtilisin family serine protease